MGDRTDFGRGLLQVKQRASTAWTADVLRFADAGACGLKDAKRHGVALRQGRVRGIQPESVSQTVDHRPTEVGGCLKREPLLVQAVPCAAQDHGRPASQFVQGQHGGSEVHHGMGIVGFNHPNDVLSHATLGIGDAVSQRRPDVVPFHANPMHDSVLRGRQSIQRRGRIPEGMVAFGRGVQLAPVGGVHQHVERSRQLEVQRSGTGIDHVACRVRQVPFVQRHTVAVPCSVQARRFNGAVSQGVHDNRHVFAPDVAHGIAGAPGVFKWVQ